MITSKKRVLKALTHKEPDCIPFDLGGTVDTGIHKDVYKKLLLKLNICKEEISICEAIQQIAEIDDEVRKKLGIDTHGLFLSVAPDFWDVEVKEESGYTTFTDPFGVEWVKPKPKGLYFDIRKHLLKGTISLEDIKNLPMPDPKDPSLINGLKEEAERIKKKEDSAIVLAACDAGIMERAEWVRGFKDFFIDLGTNLSLALSLLDKLTDFHMKYWETILDEIGDIVDVVVEADDLGMQEKPLLSPEMYRNTIKPRHKRLISFIKEIAPAYTYIFFHSCGSIYALIPDLIDVGIDILNPVQVSAAEMDTKRLKQEFGDEITFWGGGVNTQNILPNGTPNEVREEVKRRIDDLAPGGGFVFSAVHNIQADVPPENIIAVLEALQEYGSY